MTKLFDQVAAQLQAHHEKLAAILVDQDLSQEGKHKAAEALKAESLAAITRTGTAAWHELESAYIAAERAQRTAANSANANVDWARASYAAQMVPSLLSSSASMSDVEGVYNSLADTVVKRAFAEVGPAIIAKMGFDADEKVKANTFLKTLRKDLVAATETPAMVAARKVAEQVVPEIVSAKKLTQEALSEFGQLGGAMLDAAPTNELAKFDARVGVHIHYDGAAARTDTTVSIAPAGEPGAA